MSRSDANSPTVLRDNRVHVSMRGEPVPALGFGTYHLTGPEGVAAIRHALEVGYRHIDTASRYGNEAEVGTALAASGIDRGDIFLATKLRHTDLEAEDIPLRAAESCERLRTDYVDLLYVHWPNPDGVPLDETMDALMALKRAGKARHIGVSNYTVAWLRRAVDELGTEIDCNQIEYHPFLGQNAVLETCRAMGIVVTAAVPLARGEVRHTPVLLEIAERHGRTPSQVTLRWLIQQDGVAAIPKSGSPQRIEENFSIFDFSLSESEMAAVGGLARGLRIVDPDWAPEWDLD